jgi:hypothetical protein
MKSAWPRPPAGLRRCSAPSCPPRPHAGSRRRAPGAAAWCGWHDARRQSAGRTAQSVRGSAWCRARPTVSPASEEQRQQTTPTGVIPQARPSAGPALQHHPSMHCPSSAANLLRTFASKLWWRALPAGRLWRRPCSRRHSRGQPPLAAAAACGGRLPQGPTASSALCWTSWRLLASSSTEHPALRLLRLGAPRLRCVGGAKP